ncbi:MAG TPA: hypothetical protein DIT10_11435 [Chryseobacterium sp.]|nr:hypothetical protein [Chryseobacterium sp.]
MSNLKFKKGDMVYVNTNPKVKMNVIGITSNGEISVMYFKPGFVRASSSFIPEILTLVKK